jgi:hypothetical protein
MAGCAKHRSLQARKRTAKACTRTVCLAHCSHTHSCLLRQMFVAYTPEGRRHSKGAQTGIMRIHTDTISPTLILPAILCSAALRTMTAGVLDCRSLKASASLTTLEIQDVVYRIRCNNYLWEVGFRVPSL